MTLAELVQQRIRQMFDQLAWEIGCNSLGLELTEDEWAGVPMALLTAEQALLAAWKYLTEDHQTAEDEAVYKGVS